MRIAPVFVLVLACHAGSSAAPDGPGPTPDVGDGGTDGAATRAVRLATGGLALIVSGPELGLQVTPANLADDDDVIEIHQEFYGVPWEAFAANIAPPPEWLAEMTRIAGIATASGKPVFLSLSMVDGGRNRLAAATTIAGGTVQSQEWSAVCYDFATAADGAKYQQAYVRYVEWMIDKLAPRWLTNGIELNLFFEQCPAATAGMIAATNAAYAAAKARRPDLVVFPSIQIDHLYGYDATSCPSGDRDACYDAHYAQLATLQRDRFAISSYPAELAGLAVADLPADWFTRAAARGGERAIIAETGANSTTITIATRDAGCQTLFPADETAEAAYLARVLHDAAANQLELVNWWSDRDLLVAPLMTQCPCTFDASWCAALDAFRGPPTTSGPDTQAAGELDLKAFGTMGLRAYDGTPKPALSALWTAARAAPLEP